MKCKTKCENQPVLIYFEVTMSSCNCSRPDRDCKKCRENTTMNITNDLRPTKQIDSENLNSKKVFIQYPIQKICNFRCSYCFHQEFFERKENVIPYENNLGFTIDQFKLWMETHIYPNFDEIVIHFSGGEPFWANNLGKLLEIVNSTDPNVKFDFLTNGSIDASSHLNTFKDRIYRVGHTFHRFINYDSTYVKNISRLKNMGIPVYAKEILFKDNIYEIIKAKRHWESLGIQFNIQDYQALDASSQPYNSIDLSLISDEYKHQGNYCSCWQGWKSISIRGYDIAAGEVIACWLDPKIIGNIANNTLDLNFKVVIDQKLGRRDVRGGEFKYSSTGTFDRDRRSCEH